VEAQARLLEANPKVTIMIANADTFDVGIVEGCQHEEVGSRTISRS
jgi:hypothetical protein